MRQLFCNLVVQNTSLVITGGQLDADFLVIMAPFVVCEKL
jgi:hypothetical protein